MVKVSVPQVAPTGGITKVVTLTVLLTSETFPAASLALTVKLYNVSGVNPVTLKVLAVVVANKIPSLNTS